MEVVDHDKKKIICKVVGGYAVEEPTDHEEIVLRGMYLNFPDKDEEGVVREGSSEFSYLLMLIKL